MERIEVATRKSLKDAIDNKYKVIVIIGDLADEVLKELNDKKKEKISKLSDLSIILGWFLWPLLIAGVAGKIISKDDFKKYNVNTDAIHIEKGEKSGVATILVKHSTGERAVFFERSTASEPVFLDTHKQLIKEAFILHVNGRHRQFMCSAMALAQKAGTIISLDGGAQRYDEEMKSITESSHITIVARDYAEKYTGTTNLEEACRIIHDRGAIIAGVTDGANGSYFVWPDGTFYRCQAFPQEYVVDTTGAGDSFHGAFLSKLVTLLRELAPVEGLKTSTYAIDLLQHCGHSDLEKAAIFASAVAALNTQGIGGRSALPSLQVVHKLMGLE